MVRGLLPILLFITNENIPTIFPLPVKTLCRAETDTPIINKRQLKEIVVQQREDLKRKDRGIKRENLGEIGKYLKIPHVLIISGVRQSGKSTLLTPIMSEWFDEQFYYLNFEDGRLIYEFWISGFYDQPT